MSLLSPLFLLGLLGLGLPLLAHLLGRERPQKIRFAAMRFVSPREPVITQRRSIRDWPLLLIRLLLLALLVLVLARPVVGSEAEVTVLAEPHDAVVLLDASASMELMVEGRSDRERARERLETLLEAMPPGSRIGLVISDPRAPQVELEDVGEGVARIRARVDEWSTDAKHAQRSDGPRPGGWTLAEALPQALALLGERDGDRPRVVYAIGDPTSGGLGSLPAVAGEAVTIIPVPTRGRAGEPAPEPPEHVGLRELSWTPAPELDPRAIRIEAVAHRFGGSKDEQLEVGVALVIGDEEVARTRVTLNADGDAPIEFVHTPTGSATEPLRARVEILDRPEDPLGFDDRRHVWLTAQDAIDVLIVNGDPSDTRANDEIFFFATALGSSEGGALEVRGVAPDQLEDQLAREGDPLAGVDLLVLANVRAPESELASTIVTHVEQGMGLWISVGDRVSANEYNQRFSTVLPLLLREAVYAGTAPGRTEARGEGLAPISLAHPIFAGMGAGEGDLDLGTTRTKRMFLLDPDPRRGADIALAFSSGAPALMTREYGKGRVGLLTTTMDRDWGDLPLRPGFVPLVVRTAHWLADAGGAGTSGRVRIGAGQKLGQPTPYIVHGPSGEALPVAPERADEPAYFSRTDWAGHYRAVPSGGEDGGGELFVVEVDPRESDTTPIAVAGAELAGEAGTVTIYSPRWRELAMLVLLLLGLESALRWWLSRLTLPAGPSRRR